MIPIGETYIPLTVQTSHSISYLLKLCICSFRVHARTRRLLPDFFQRVRGSLCAVPSLNAALGDHVFDQRCSDEMLSFRRIMNPPQHREGAQFDLNEFFNSTQIGSSVFRNMLTLQFHSWSVCFFFDWNDFAGDLTEQFRATNSHTFAVLGLCDACAAVLHLSKKWPFPCHVALVNKKRCHAADPRKSIAMTKSSCKQPDGIKTDCNTFGSFLTRRIDAMNCIRNHLPEQCALLPRSADGKCLVLPA